MSKASLTLSILIHAGALAGMVWIDSSGVVLPPLAGGPGEGLFEVGLTSTSQPEAPTVPQGVSEEARRLLQNDPSLDLVPCPQNEPTADQGPMIGGSEPVPIPAPPAPTEEESKPAEDTDVGGLGTEAPGIDDPTALRPMYPLTCRRLRHQGVVVLQIKVSADGKVSEAKVSRSAGCLELDEAALAAVLRARFRPGRSWGRAVESVVEQAFKFELRGR